MHILGDDSIVHLIVESEALRAQIVAAVERAGGRTQMHSRLREFLAHDRDCLPGCLVVEVPAGRAAGLESLWNAKPATPMIVVSASEDVETAVEVMRQGAFDCFELPLAEEENFLLAIAAAMHCHADNRLRAQRHAELRSRVESLTPREREVMSLVIEGTLNKIIASQLGLSRRTVETHRTNVMAKMRATSVVQLINMSLILEEAETYRSRTAPVWRRNASGSAMKNSVSA